MSWTDACATEDIEKEDLIRWDHGGRTFVLVHGVDGRFYCLDGLCTHEQVHLCDGLVIDNEIECPKHSGVFDYMTGRALRAPACLDIATFPVRVENGRVMVEIAEPTDGK